MSKITTVKQKINPPIAGEQPCFATSAYDALIARYDVDHKDLSEPAVQTITTHCAKIYLINEFAIKVKLSVNYSYINTVNLDDRKTLLLRELELNKPHLPNIYLEVAAIVIDADGCFQFRFRNEKLSEDEVVEWCLIMRRFAEETVLDNIARKGRLTKEISKELGKSIAAYHNSSAVHIVTDGDTRIHEVLQELDLEFEKLAAIFPAVDLTQFRKKGAHEYELVENLLCERGKNGYIRRCHGDLHLRNILLDDGTPVPFDALEFNERFAIIDVLYDLAFLLMDLDHRELRVQQNAVLNEYMLHATAEGVHGLKLLPLFMFCRAGIKAMTSAQSLLVAQQKNHHGFNESKAYLRSALNCIRQRKPVTIAIGGFSGSGKSTIAIELAHMVCNAPGALLIRSDSERKSEFQVPEKTNLGKSHYTAANTQRVYSRLFEKATAAITAKYPVIVDATFMRQEQRIEIEKIAKEGGSEFHGFWLMAPVSTLRNRIEKRQSDASDADVSVLEKQLVLNKGYMDWCAIDTSSTVQSSVKNILERAEAIDSPGRRLSRLN